VALQFAACTNRFEGAGNVDVEFDLFGGETQTRLWAIRGNGRRLVSISKLPDDAKGDAVGAMFSDATRAYLISALPQLTDRLNFRFFCKSSFPWFQVIEGILPDTQGHFTDYADEKVTWETLLDEIDNQFGVSSTTLNVLIQELDMRSKTPPPAKGAVPCFTIHASKGMEFGHVYLIGMVEDQLPSWGAVKKGPQSQEIQEERRNCFVAITRTEETLTMTYSQRMFGWSKIPSRFLKEMGFVV